MAVAFDGATSGQTNSGTSVTVNHTPGGSNRAVAAGFVWYGAVGSITLSDFTYAGTTMDAQEAVDVPNDNGEIELRTRTNPPATAQDCVATVTGGSTAMSLGVVSATNVDQTTAVEATHTAQATGTSTAPSVACTTDSGELVVDTMGNFDETPTVDGSQDERWSIDAGPGTQWGSGSTEVASGASTTMSWSLSASGEWGIAAIAFNEAAGAANPPTGGIYGPVVGPLGGPV